MSLRIHLLGPMQAFGGISAIKLPPRARHLSLWAFLLLHRRQPTPRDLLAYTFWPPQSVGLIAAQALTPGPAAEFDYYEIMAP